MKKFKLLLLTVALSFSPITWILFIKKNIFFIYHLSLAYHTIKNINSCNIHPTVSFKNPTRIKLGKNIRIQNNCCIWAGDGEISIGENSGIGPGTVLFGSNHSTKKGIDYIEQKSIAKPIFIGKDVWIGANCVILPGVEISNGAVIGAGSVVTKSIPENAIAVGNPAKVMKFRI